MRSNLPPGVTDSMIPGNRPEDIAFDKFAEQLYLVTPHMADEEFDRLLNWVWEELQRAETAGYNQGYVDSRDQA